MEILILLASLAFKLARLFLFLYLLFLIGGGETGMRKLAWCFLVSFFAGWGMLGLYLALVVLW